MKVEWQTNSEITYEEYIDVEIHLFRQTCRVE